MIHTKYMQREGEERAATISGWAQLAVAAVIMAAVWGAILRGAL